MKLIALDSVTTVRNKFRLADHPWLAMGALLVSWVLMIALVASMATTAGMAGDAPYRGVVVPLGAHLITLFVLAPFVLGLPNGRVSMRRYLEDIRLWRPQPFGLLLVLGVSSSLIMLLILALSVLAFRLAQGLPVTPAFLRWAFDLRRDLPPGSLGWLVSFPSIFEEVAWRGVLLVVFMRRYSARTSIAITALGFGLLHLINLGGSMDPSFVARQVIFGSALGLFYGYLTLRAGSLLPGMVFHYLVNWFIGSAVYYTGHYASVEVQVLCTLASVLAAVPVLILWVKVFCGKSRLLRRKNRNDSSNLL